MKTMLALALAAGSFNPTPLYTIKGLSLSEPGCKQSCAYVEIEYPEILKAGSPAALAKIQPDLQREIAANTLIDKHPKDVQGELAAYFAESAKEHKRYPEGLAWTLYQYASVMQAGPRVLSVKIQSDLFTGGAHGIQSTTFANYDLQTGLPLKYTDMLKPGSHAALLKLGEEYFRAENRLDEGQGLNSTEFTFENEKFGLPKTVGIYRNGLMFYYNTYEISYYAYGPTELFIDYYSLRDLLKPEWRKLLVSADVE